MRAGWLVLVFSQWWRSLWTISVWYSLSFVWSCQQTEGNFHLSSHLFFFWFLPQYLATQNTPTTTKTCRPCVTTSHPGSIRIGGLSGPGYFPESTRPSPDCQKCRPPVQCSFPWVGRCNEKCEKLKTFLHNFSPLREVQGRAPPGAPAGVLVEPLHLLRPTPPSRQQRRGGRQQLHHGSSSPVRNGPGNPGVNTLTLLQAEILRVTLKLCNGTLFPKKILIISYECQDSPGHSPPRRGPPPSPHCPPGWRTRAGRSRCPGGCRHCRSPLCRWRGRRRADHWSPLSGRNLINSVSWHGWQEWRILTAGLQTLQALSAFPGDVRSPSAGLELRLGALEATAALVIGVLTTLTAGGGRGALQVTTVTTLTADLTGQLLLPWTSPRLSGDCRDRPQCSGGGGRGRGGSGRR